MYFGFQDITIAFGKRTILEHVMKLPMIHRQIRLNTVLFHLRHHITV